MESEQKGKRGKGRNKITKLKKRRREQVCKGKCETMAEEMEAGGGHKKEQKIKQLCEEKQQKCFEKRKQRK